MNYGTLNFENYRIRNLLNITPATSQCQVHRSSQENKLPKKENVELAVEDQGLERQTGRQWKI